MKQLPLVLATKGPDQFLAYVYDRHMSDPLRVLMNTIPLTEQDNANLALKGAGGPPGVTREDWENGRACVVGYVPDYGGGRVQLGPGEYVELPDRFEVGVQRRDGTTLVIKIPKDKVDVTRTGGLTVTKTQATAWSAFSEIVSIERDVLTVEG